ncbi:MAG: hypothetical protein ACPHJ0_06935 [Arenicellales bacterium]
MIHLISDLHLSPEHPEVFNQFDEYLADLNAGEDLYILGDLLNTGLVMTPWTFLGTTRRNNFYAPYPIEG